MAEPHMRHLLRADLDAESAADMRWLLHILDREPNPMAGIEVAQLTLDVLAAVRSRLVLLDVAFARDDPSRALLLVSWRDLRKVAEAVLRPAPQKQTAPMQSEWGRAEELICQPSAASVEQNNDDSREADFDDGVSDGGPHRDYRKLDEPLVREMQELVRDKKIKPWAASKMVVKRAAGSATTSEESKRRRLCKMYRLCDSNERMNS